MAASTEWAVRPSQGARPDGYQVSGIRSVAASSLHVVRCSLKAPFTLYASLTLCNPTHCIHSTHAQPRRRACVLWTEPLLTTTDTAGTMMTTSPHSRLCRHHQLACRQQRRRPRSVATASSEQHGMLRPTCCRRPSPILPTVILFIITHSRLKSFLFCKSSLPQPFLFLLQDSLYGFPRLFTVTSEHIRIFTF